LVAAAAKPAVAAAPEWPDNVIRFDLARRRA
jgi:hypothetical protein